MIRRLKTKDKTNFLHFCSKKDSYEDFYITKDNKRLFLTDSKIALKVFKNCLKHGDICYVSEENNIIKGLLIITGYSDKSVRKYVKILANNTDILKELLKYFNWTYNKEVYFKLNTKHPVVELLRHPYKPSEFKRGYKFLGGRGAQILIVRSKNGNNYKNNKKSYRRPTSKRR